MCREVLGGRKGGVELPLKLHGTDVHTLHTCLTSSSLSFWLLDEMLEVLFWAEKGMEVWAKYSASLITNGQGVQDRLLKNTFSLILALNIAQSSFQNLWKDIFREGRFFRQTHQEFCWSGSVSKVLFKFTVFVNFCHSKKLLFNKWK